MYSIYYIAKGQIVFVDNIVPHELHVFKICFINFIDCRK